MLMRNWIMTWASIVCCPLVLAAAAPASIATAGEVTTDMARGRNADRRHRHVPRRRHFALR